MKPVLSNIYIERFFHGEIEKVEVSAGEVSYLTKLTSDTAATVTCTAVQGVPTFAVGNDAMKILTEAGTSVSSYEDLLAVLVLENFQDQVQVIIHQGERSVKVRFVAI